MQAECAGVRLALHVRYARWCAALPRTLHFAVDVFSRRASLLQVMLLVGLLEDTSFVRWLVMPAVSRYLSAPAGAQRQSMTTRKDLQSDFQEFACGSHPSGLESIPFPVSAGFPQRPPRASGGRSWEKSGVYKFEEGDIPERDKGRGISGVRL